MDIPEIGCPATLGCNMDYGAEVVLPEKATLGEGSIWDARSGVLYWVDIPRRLLFVYNPKTGRNRSIDVGSDIGTVVPRRSGGVAVMLRDHFAAVDLASGNVTVLVRFPVGPNERCNDGKCDPAGRFWAGTQAEKGKARLYCLEADHRLRQVLDGLTISNGLVWTRDRKTMYYIDTPTQQVSAFDYDLASGGISNRRPAVQVPKEMGHPDGMTIDAEDKLWVALFGGGAVGRFDPLTGRLVDRVEVPGAKKVSSCALGGEKLDELYITTASKEMSEADWREQPNAGSLFRVNVQVSGVPAAEYAG